MKKIAFIFILSGCGISFEAVKVQAGFTSWAEMQNKASTKYQSGASAPIESDYENLFEKKVTYKQIRQDLGHPSTEQGGTNTSVQSQ